MPSRPDGGPPVADVTSPQIIARPLPSRYQVLFGPPMRFEGEGDEEDRIVRGYVREVQSAIEGLLARGLARRESVYL